MNRRVLTVVSVWLLTLAICAGVIWRTPFAADLSAFMPKMPTARQQLLMDQFKHGIIARLIMVGIEGGDEAERARLSLALGQALRPNPMFLAVQNGDEASTGKDQAYFFGNRYLLSPSVTPERFTAEGMHQAIQQALDALSGSAGMLLKQLFLKDPTAETLNLIEQFQGESQPRTVNGAWASPDGHRALLLLQTRADGADTDAQAKAIAQIESAFQSIPNREQSTQLVMTGTGVFSVSSRATIESEVHILATASTLLVMGLLWLVYRSWWLLLLGLVPVLTAALAGICAVGLIFGQVHGLTLAFGTTLIGEAVDYAIYLFMQRATGQPSQQFWRTIRLGVCTSLAGFLALLWSGFPGLSQLGVYAVFGLLAAVLVTRYVLPVLMPAQPKMRDLSRAGAWVMSAVGKLGQGRALLAIATLCAMAWLGTQHDRIWSRQLTELNPVPKSAQALDASLRHDLGALDLRYIVSLSAKDDEQALQAAERASKVLTQAVGSGEIASFKSPSMVLPSAATQKLRQSALPASAESGAARLSEAMVGLPVKSDRLSGFLDDMAKARERAPLSRADLKDTSAAMLVDSLLVQRSDDVLVLLPLKAVDTGPHADTINTDALTQRLRAAGLGDATVLDILTETSDVFTAYLRATLTMAGAGAVAVTLLLWFNLRSISRTARVVLPLVGAVCGVAAVLVAFGQSLNILHLVGLLLVVAVGSNYALFFDNGLQGQSLAEQRQTLSSLVLANLTTVGTYGMLGLSSIPVLSALGRTVALGTFLALILSAALAKIPDPEERLSA